IDKTCFAKVLNIFFSPREQRCRTRWRTAFPADRRLRQNAMRALLFVPSSADSVVMFSRTAADCHCQK
ncbi:MAG: hypothetical protein WA867_12665, partial [Candidatus Acidiferrales bacterium]